MRILSTRQYSAGYEMRQVLWDDTDIALPKGTVLVTKGAYTANGDYIGSLSEARTLYKLGLMPEKDKPSDNKCTIAFHRKTNKWYGLSSSDLKGFGVGDTINADDQWVRCLPLGMLEFVAQAGRFTVTDLNQCRVFAASWAVWANGG